ncbi:anaerobic ribonucleoside-triphosphate reductase activating protein [Paenibacillus chitinolyticus]|uniref:anaerobic ribonucleoside-triphosphate reductase activating protein n=1 Tax=Paenibacillus chitinolyticus TaxID=79263 RepID=UPI003670AAC7
MNICGYAPETIDEGEGLRTALYISGCRHYCRGCFSPRTWDFDYGTPMGTDWEERIIAEIQSNPLLDGLSILGGDPFFSAGQVSSFLDRLRQRAGTVNVWIYSGYTYEELAANPESGKFGLLSRCQVLVDGRYVEELRDPALLYRGSRNQRLIDIEASLRRRKAVLWQSAWDQEPPTA